MTILVACEHSGRIRDALTKRGFDAVSCDLKISDTPGKHYVGDVREILFEANWDAVIAHPPFTHTAVSGNRWFKEKIADGRQQQGIDFFLMFTKLKCPFAIEHPVSIMSTKYRKPDQIIQPYQFGHPTTKKTCLWLQELPLLVPTDVVEPEWYLNPDGTSYRDLKGKRYPRWHMKTGGGLKNSAELRSITYQGIADAMADQWGDYLRGRRGYDKK